MNEPSSQATFRVSSGPIRRARPWQRGMLGVCGVRSEPMGRQQRPMNRTMGENVESGSAMSDGANASISAVVQRVVLNPLPFGER
jgi:hypothetical protein